MNERAVQDALAKIPRKSGASARIVSHCSSGYFGPKRSDPLTPSIEQRTEAGRQRGAPGAAAQLLFPAWRTDGKPSRIRALLPKHPIVAGLPEKFTLRTTEMYDEPFHVPAPDEVVFEDAGTRRALSQRLRVEDRPGTVFYFRPGTKPSASIAGLNR